MLKKIFSFILSGMTLFSAMEASSDYITYDWLTDVAVKTGYTDHIPHWRRLFNTMNVRGFMECGVGFSTAYFMDNCEKVISIEYITPGYGDKWYKEAVLLYADRTNWIPMTYNSDYRSNSFNNAAAYQCSIHKDYAAIDAAYLRELYQHFKTQIKDAHDNGYDIDVAFVDPGIYLRGDLVKLLLAQNIPVVAAHDTASDGGIYEVENLYGWNKVITPQNYVKIYIPYGQGTTFWINDQYPAVITSILKYRDGILQLKEAGINVGFKELTELADRP